MKNLNFLYRHLCQLLIGGLLLVPMSLSWADAFVRIEGVNQGLITSGASPTIAGHEDDSLVIGYGHSVTVPRDPQSGQPTGQRVHQPLTIYKPVDKATPLLYQALVTSERLPVVELRFFTAGAQGNVVNYYTVRLEDAIITDMSSALVTIGNQSEVRETVSFTYRVITWTNELGGTSGTDDWRAPRI